jgi:valyl-tRNA synthetase
MLARLADVVREATEAFEAYDHTRALQVTEAFFWTFCDDYVELVKDRAYGAHGEGLAASARAALARALEVQLRLFAPFVPFATEEVWSWWRSGSVHRATWPDDGELRALADGADGRLLDVVGTALAGIRKAKSEAKVSMRTEVSRAVVVAPDADLALLQTAAPDLRGAGRICDLHLAPAPDGTDGVMVEAVELTTTA